jgi:hypothetical protein
MHAPTRHFIKRELINLDDVPQGARVERGPDGKLRAVYEKRTEDEKRDRNDGVGGNGG